MTTNNHPANSPVSLDRLHQISEILSKASAQSDGGNLGYAMADAVKVINGLFDSEPVAYMTYKGYLLHAGDPKVSEYSEPTPLYTAPVLPDELLSAMQEVLRISDRDHEAWHKAKNGISACRAAMIQAGNHTEQHLDMVNSPVIPDGYVLVPKEITCAMDDAAWEAYHETRCMSDIWAALLAAAPQHEVKK